MFVNMSIFKYAKYGPVQLAFATFTAGIALDNLVMEVVGGALLALMLAFVVVDIVQSRRGKEEKKPSVVF